MDGNVSSGSPGIVIRGRVNGYTWAERSRPVVRSGFGPCDRAACPTESHLSHLIPLIPLDPTYPTESHLSHGIPLIPRDPIYPTESHLSHGIPLIPRNPTYPTGSHLSDGIPLIPRDPTHPTESHLSRLISLNPGKSRIGVLCSIPPLPVPLPTYSFPSIAGRSLRSLGSAPFGARRGRAVRTFGPGGRRGYVAAQVFSPSPPLIHFPQSPGTRSARLAPRLWARGGGEGRGEEGALARVLPADGVR